MARNGLVPILTSTNISFCQLNMIILKTHFSSDEWKAITKNERKKLGLTKENDGEFWWLKHIITASKCLLDFKPFHAFQDVPGGLCGPVLHDFPVQTDQHLFAFDFQGEDLFAPKFPSERILCK